MASKKKITKLKLLKITKKKSLNSIFLFSDVVRILESQLLLFTFTYVLSKWVKGAIDKRPMGYANSLNQHLPVFVFLLPTGMEV